MLAGAFGAVYKATLDEVDQVAVKMLPSDQLKDGQIKAFLTEVWTDIPAMCDSAVRGHASLVAYGSWLLLQHHALHMTTSHDPAQAR